MSGHLTNASTESLGAQNTLALSEALTLMERVPTAIVELCYIDPPLFPKLERSGRADEDENELTGARVMREHLLGLASVMQQARRCLSQVGNLFVHSEPEMNGSIRLLLDQVFGRKNFCQEIVIPRMVRRAPGWPASGHDTVFHFRVGPDFVFNQQTRDLAQDEIADQYSRSDNHGPYRLATLVSPFARPALSFSWQGTEPPPGRSWKFPLEKLEQLFDEGRIVAQPGRVPQLKQYASDSPGVDIDSVWDDIPLSVPAAEQAAYPTQKPERLVGRIIAMGSNPGGLVLDPFCGSGTTLVTAHNLGRRWVGGDNSPNAVHTATRRLQSSCGLEAGTDFISTTEAELRTINSPHVFQPLRIATGFDDLVIRSVNHFIFGRPLQIEETREHEFKEVKSNRPLETIANTADEYAVSFLNSEGGRIFWGVRDADMIVVGVKLTAGDRDRLRQLVTNKLLAIRPSIDPTAYRLEIHPVEHSKGTLDLFVVELVVPRVRASDPYYTAGNEAFVRLDGVKRKLTGPELTEWIRRRISNT